jgi:hypothetical protein
MRLSFWYRLISLALFIAPMVLFGQDGPLPEEEPPCGPPFGPACVPIDGGISFLIAAGVALGGKKAYNLYKGNR